MLNSFARSTTVIRNFGVREFEDAFTAAGTRTSSRNYVRGILKERTGNEIKKHCSEKEEREREREEEIKRTTKLQNNVQLRETSVSRFVYV